MDQKEKDKWLKKLREFIRTKHLHRVLRGHLSSLALCDSRKLSLVVDDQLSPRTDGKTIWVSLLPYFLAEEYEPYWGVYFRPILAHEVEHVNSTKFSYMKEIRDWYAKRMEGEGFSEKIGRSIAGDFLNVTEDGRIEQISVERNPGLFAPFVELNRAIRAGCTIEKVAEEPQQEFHDFFGTILSYAKTGMYPEGIELYSGSELEDNFLAIRSYIDVAVNGTGETCYAATKSLLEDALPYIAKLLKDSQDLQDEMENKEGGSEYEGCDGDGDAKPGSGSSGGNGGNGDEKGEGKSLRASSPTGKFGGAVADSGSETSITEGQGTNYTFAAAGENPPEDVGYDASQIEAMQEAFEQATRIAAQQEAKEEAEKNQGDGPNEEEVDKLLQKAYGHGRNGFHVQWLKDIAPQPLPADLSFAIKALRKELEKVITSKTQRRDGCKSGRLDYKSLWKTGLGAKDVFYRPGRTNPADCAFYLLVDNSGSMSSCCYKDVTKCFAARRAAAIVEGAVKGLFPVKIALFDTDGRGATHTCLKPFESKGNTNFSWSSLQVIAPRGCNEDSAHIRVAAQELSSRKEKNKFLIVLSDGCPSAYASRNSAVAEVKKAVDDAEKIGVKVISIMFGDENFRESYMDTFKQMYSKNLLSVNPEEIDRRLPLLLRNIIFGH